MKKEFLMELFEFLGFFKIGDLLLCSYDLMYVLASLGTELVKFLHFLIFFEVIFFEDFGLFLEIFDLWNERLFEDSLLFLNDLRDMLVILLGQLVNFL